MEELPARAYRKTNERYVVNAIAGRQARSDVLAINVCPC